MPRPEADHPPYLISWLQLTYLKTAFDTVTGATILEEIDTHYPGWRLYIASFLENHTLEIKSGNPSPTPFGNNKAPSFLYRFTLSRESSP